MTDEEQHRLTQKLTDGITELVGACISRCDGIIESLRLCVSVSGHTNCMLGMGLSPRGVSKPTNEAICVAAMMSYVAAPTARDEGFQVSVGPEEWLEALAMAERVLGRSPDSGLNSKFINTLRDYQRSAEAPLAAFLASNGAKEAPLN